MTLGSLSSLAGGLKKASLAGAFFVPAIWLSAVQAQALCPAPQPLSYTQVERVVDGDTLRLKDGRSVRMIGLNAPETGKTGQSAEPFADAARKRLQSLVALSVGRVGLLPGKQTKQPSKADDSGQAFWSGRVIEKGVPCGRLFCVRDLAG